MKEHASKAQPRVKQAKILRDPERTDPADGLPRSRGLGFVEFTEHEHAICALRHLNNNPAPFSKNSSKACRASCIQKYHVYPCLAFSQVVYTATGHYTKRCRHLQPLVHGCTACVHNQHRSASECGVVGLCMCRVQNQHGRQTGLAMLAYVWGGCAGRDKRPVVEFALESAQAVRKMATKQAWQKTQTQGQAHPSSGPAPAPTACTPPPTRPHPVRAAETAAVRELTGCPTSALYTNIIVERQEGCQFPVTGVLYGVWRR